MCGGAVGKPERRVDWMVLRRERSGGGRVFAGGRMTLLVVGEDPRLMVVFESSIDGSALMTPTSSSFPGVSCSVFADSSWMLGLSLKGSSFNAASRLIGPCSSFSDGGRGPGKGIEGVGNSL